MATFNNFATLSYNGNTITSNTITGEIVEVLSASKTAVESEYESGGKITYTVSLVNTGTSAFSNLTLTDNLGSYTFNSSNLVPLDYIEGSVKYYVNGVLQTAPTVSSTNPLTITGISVPAEGNSAIIYSVETNQYAPLAADSDITNTVTVTGTGLSSDVTADETVTPSTAPSLSILKSVNPTTVSENGELTYTFTIQNMGNTAVTSSDDVIVSDTFDPLLNSIGVTLNGSALTSSDYTYNTGTGAFATNSSLITVPAATYTQDSTTGAWSVVPGTTTLEVTGTLS